MDHYLIILKDNPVLMRGEALKGRWVELVDVLAQKLLTNPSPDAEGLAAARAAVASEILEDTAAQVGIHDL